MSVAEALSRVLVYAHPLPAESVALTDAHGRVLTSDIAALRSQPPGDVSAMDGYAVRALDGARTPARLEGDRRGGGGARRCPVSLGGVCPRVPIRFSFRKTPRSMAKPSSSKLEPIEAETSASK